MSYFKNNEDAYDYHHLWYEFEAQCRGPGWDDPEYCDELNKWEWFESWLIDNGYLKYKEENELE